jgi:hypothetical protein
MKNLVSLVNYEGTARFSVVGWFWGVICLYETTHIVIECPGLNNPRKREVGKNLLRQWRGDVVCLQETKLDSVDFKTVCSLWGNLYVGWEPLNAVNTA